MISSLQVPDDPALHRDADYSFAVAHALISAYMHLRRSPRDTAGYARALAVIEECAGSRMSLRQRLHVLFVLAMAYAALGNTSQALHWLDESVHISAALSDHGALTELLYLRGAVHQSAGHFSESADDLRLCLRIACEGSREDAATDPEIYLQVLISLAGMEFLLARYDSAEALLTEASNRARLKPQAHLEIATIAWIYALLDRWRGCSDRALRSAVDAFEVYSQMGSPASSTRIAVVVADLALDMAASFPEGLSSDARQAHARIAGPYIAQSNELTRDASDPAGKGLALLVQARYARIAGRSENILTTVERVIQLARRITDAPLLAQALTALGDQLSATGEVESGLNCYRQALDAVNSGDVPALGVWAQRALLLHSELVGGR